jgi:polyisoprenoid-binding protein YceI
MTASGSTSAAAPGSVAAFVADGGALGAWTLDAAASSVEFDTTSMWGLAKVHGVFGSVSGSGVVAADATVTGGLEIDAASVDSKIKKRDDHLRSKDFFHVEQHPTISVAVSGITPLAGDQVQVQGTLTARGHQEPLTFAATVTEATADAVTFKAELPVDRSRFGMTWSPLRMATMHAKITVTARFLRA